MAKDENIEAFWDGVLAGIVTVIILLAVIIVICHFCGYPVFIVE